MNFSATSLLGTDLTKRKYGLDIMRMAAIMFVFIGHMLDLVPKPVEDVIKPFILDGVGIFFVLSGFLIGGILIKTINKSFEGKDLITFWINRWLRTLPPYYFILTILLVSYAVFDIYLYPEPLSFKDTLKYYFFVQGLAWIMPNFFSESWSLCVEEWFYLITPICLFILCTILKIRPKRSLIIVAVGIILSVTLYRLFRHSTLGLEYTNSYNFIFFYKQVVTRLDAIMYGIIGAYLAHYYPLFWEKCKYIAFALGIMLIVALQNFTHIMDFFNINTPEYYWLYLNVFNYTLSSISFLLLLPFFQLMKRSSGFIYKLITYISLISYSLYLVHYTLVKYVIIDEFINSTATVNLLAYWVLSFMIATLMYKFLEKPVMDIRPTVLRRLKLKN